MNKSTNQPIDQSTIYLTVSKSAVWLKAYPLKSRSLIKYSVIFRPKQVNLIKQKIIFFFLKFILDEIATKSQKFFFGSCLDLV